MKSKKENYTKKMDIIKSIISLIFICISIFTIVTSFNSPNNINGKSLYSYNVKKDVNYKVYLKENDFYDKEYLGMDKTYLSSLAKNISLDFIYSLNSSKKQNMTYDYNIIATIYVNSANTNENLWEKDIVLLENKKITLDNTSSAKIEESVDVDFNLYNNMVKDFRNNLSTPTISYLTVKLNVNHIIDTNQKDKTENQNSTIEAIINLNQDLFKVTKKTDGENKVSVTENGEEVTQVNKLQLIMGIIIFVVSSIILLNKIKGKFKFTEKSEYSVIVNKILKNYGDIVAEIVHPVNLENMEIIDVRNFDQMLDVEEELRMPILFYEITRGEEGCFIIIHNNIAYRYILRNKKKRRGLF